MEKVFVDGLKWYDPHEKAPKFVKGSISIDPKKLTDFLKANAQYISNSGYFRVDVKESKGGSIYFELNTWKPSKETSEVVGTEEVIFPKNTMTSTGYNGEDPLDMANHPFNTSPDVI